MLMMLFPRKLDKRMIKQQSLKEQKILPE